MKTGSLFDGIGGFPLASSWCDIEPVWASEIENKPISITSRHFPNMKHLGDIIKINGAEIEPVDVITFGSPCQDLSIAGKRAGLDGARSGLFMEAVRIIREMREATNGKYPRFIVWENVPGAFSSAKRQDFRAVLEEIGQASIPMPNSGKWANAGMVRTETADIAWRVLDAQYWGVPQRRKRIFLVADFRGQCAGEILFKPESLSRYFEKGSQKRERATQNVKSSTGDSSEYKLIENHPADSRVKICEDGIAQTLSSSMGTGGGNVPLLLKIRSDCEGGGKGALIQKNKSATLGCNNDQTLFEPVVYGICSYASNSMKSKNPHSGIYEATTAKTIDMNGGNPACNQGGMAICVQGSMIGRTDKNGPQGDGINEDVSFTLNATDRHAVVYENSGFAKFIEGCGTLRASGGEIGGGSENLVVYPPYSVRRLTPLECERLQGLPDEWTKNGIGHELISDTQRYKAIGNSVALPCVEFVLEMIKDQLSEVNKSKR